ncbi:polysaccharide pyruvyl transferase family protein [Kurthia massiliensis]|uniref:polysaccharide pyruvyl transferase family protein n=1 Tax=Kurthia massiliensis TaxID=1033739 RepID=UPI00028845A5|nr:polysaccharide pyruvyl transferase family protein [Kurthia massiliensis]
MKKLLMRSGMSPLKNFDAAHIVSTNSIGGNVGNLVYAYGIYRTLTTDDVMIVPDYYRINPNDADKINANYDGYIIPLADAFRPNFIGNLERYAELINRLTIPVYVIGVGARTPFDAKKGEKYIFDDATKKFVKAVLNKSAMIGVRGQITSDYLTGLGFQEGVDHMPIGCPSMYSFGRDLKIRDTNITKDSLVSINNSRLSPENVLKFIDRSRHEFANYYYIPQWLKELKMTYLGGPDLDHQDKTYPESVLDPYYTEDHVRYPVNIPTWMELLQEADLSFGARLHGNIAATIAGTPSIILPKDGRMRELTDYHQLNYYWGPDITDETNIWDIIEQSDFHKPEKVANENFDRFIGFLNKNGLDHAYKETMYPTTVPLDEQLKGVEAPKVVTPFVTAPIDEQVRRWQAFNDAENARTERRVKREVAAKKTKNNDVDAKLQAYKKEIDRLNKKVKFQEKTLNRKAVKMSLGVADKVAKLRGNK